jgi:hypothetical protein
MGVKFPVPGYREPMPCGRLTGESVADGAHALFLIVFIGITLA